MAALDDSPRPGKEPTITDAARAWVVSLACQNPPSRARSPKEVGYPHELWTTRPEGFFSKMARSVLRRIRVASMDELKARILAYLDNLNREPIIHVWTYKLDAIA
jgi:hypothetical protein